LTTKSQSALIVCGTPKLANASGAAILAATPAAKFREAKLQGRIRTVNCLFYLTAPTSANRQMNPQPPPSSLTASVNSLRPIERDINSHSYVRLWTPFLKLESMLSHVRIANATIGIVVVLSVELGKMLASQI